MVYSFGVAYAPSRKAEGGPLVGEGGGEGSNGTLNTCNFSSAGGVGMSGEAEVEVEAGARQFGGRTGPGEFSLSWMAAVTDRY